MKKLCKVMSMLCALIMLSTSISCSGGGTGNSEKDADLVITASQKGYGLEWLDAIVSGYQKKTGKKVYVNKKIGATGQSAIEMEMDAYTSTTDIFFPTGGSMYKKIYSGAITAANGKHYDTPFEPLDDVYNYTCEGESMSIKEKTKQSCLDDAYINGHYYSTPWFSGLLGIVLNKDIWTTLGFTDSDIPNTTDELFALCDEILTKDKVGGKKVAPFIYSVESEYYTSFFNIWFAQYEGKESWANYNAGKDPDGNFTEYVFTYKGQEEALKVLGRLVNKNNNYQHEKSSELSFTDMQGWFLSDQAVFCVNGSWLDIEMSNYKSKNIEFIKTPIISSLVDKLSFKTDAELSEVVEYVDSHMTTGDNDGKPSFATDEDVEIVREARRNSYNGGGGGTAFIPSYANHIEEAKNFLKYMYSDEGLRLYYTATGGGLIPVRTTDNKYPDIKLSVFRKNIIDILEEGFITSDRSANTKLFTLGGIASDYSNGCTGFPTGALRGATDIDAVVKQILDNNQNYISSRWSSISHYCE